MNAKRTGFTLIELIATVAIVAILAAAAAPMLEVSARRAKESELRSALRSIRGAIDAYKTAVDEGHVTRKADESGYPPTLAVLAEGVADAKDPQKRRIYFLRRIPRDPFSPDPSLAVAQTWGLRSYASPPEAPIAGDDVFDVHSLSAGTGLNGIPYREW
ncbi:MAG: prepilin-type N-terminal cleavage/methylation domain-containing protein [Betaproteobacteria bacterium]|nr:prepilin-type N-terminal cleavage/methylation domain-containing protein [Betaproteobacteria bacterium]